MTEARKMSSLLVQPFSQFLFWLKKTSRVMVVGNPLPGGGGGGATNGGGGGAGTVTFCACQTSSHQVGEQHLKT